MTNNDNAVVVATFVLYFVVMLIIGYAAWKRSSDFSDYALGGRSLGPFATAISAGASEMSGWLMVAMPGAAYLSGLSAFWIAAGLLAGSLLNWLLVAQRLRVYSFVANDALTIPEFLAERFQRHTGGLRLVASIFIIVFYLFYTSSGLVAGGKLLNTVFGMNYELAVVVGLLAIVSYTFFGGYLAVSWTDVLQGIMMLLALVAVPVAAVMELGGVTASLESVRETSPMLLRWFTDAASGETLGWIVVASSLAWGLGYFGQPHSLARFAGIDDHRHIPRARLLSVSWTGIGLACALAIGVLGHGFFPAGLDDQERIFMFMVDILFNPVVAGVLLTAILAAVMSTADSQLLICSSTIADDLYKAMFRQHASQRELLRVGRLAVLGVSVIALLLALAPDSNVLGLVSYAWAGFGASFGPTLLLALYWKRMNQWGALAGIIVGGVTVIVWSALHGGLFDLYEILPGFLFSLIAIVVVSLATAAPHDAVTRQFETMEAELVRPEPVAFR
ncbi:sodium/proline symporter PutP [Salinicola corii]|uniref:Sodium/proline symporter n=1 Tax=Salinicola corii TaxID=2606937 RepID=A0A640WF11_9GAMM|nr:sodium/proline symporter PutP [Salinicola corii]KAA0018718.1 sodium/proline symporter PutP [Salinicola corii]